MGNALSYLLDTHIFLWYINGDIRLNDKYRKIIENTRNDIYVSVISFWEIIIKSKLGKIEIPSPIFSYLNEKRKLHQIDIIDFESTSLPCLEELQAIHKDPFDRLLICQAMHYELILITDDAIIFKYPVKVVDQN